MPRRCWCRVRSTESLRFQREPVTRELESACVSKQINNRAQRVKQFDDPIRRSTTRIRGFEFGGRIERWVERRALTKDFGPTLGWCHSFRCDPQIQRRTHRSTDCVSRRTTIRSRDAIPQPRRSANATCLRLPEAFRKPLGRTSQCEYDD